MRGTTLVLVILALAGTGCGSSALMPRGAQSSPEVEELKRRVVELQKQSTVHELEIERLRKRIESLETGSAPARSQPAARAPSSISPPPPRIRDAEPTETYRRPEIDQSDLDVEGFGQPVEPPLDPDAEGAPPAVAVRTLPPPGTVAAPDPRPRPPAPVPAAAQALYDEGYTYYHQDRFVDAESAFRRFLQSYGDTDLADNAQYWIGESRYARKDYRAALAAFRETVERYPDGNKVPDALIKAGQCFEALGDDDAAAATYREVMRRFPSSAASVAAAEYLENLG